MRPVQLAQRSRRTRPNAKDVGNVQRRAGALQQQFATGILEDEGRSTLERRQRQGPHRPRGIQFVTQRMFVLEHPNRVRSRVLRPRHHHEHRTRLSGIRYAAASIQGELTVLENGLEPVGRELHRRSIHATAFHVADLMLGRPLEGESCCPASAGSVNRNVAQSAAVGDRPQPAMGFHDRPALARPILVRGGTKD
jgi:hypothetical protein